MNETLFRSEPRLVPSFEEPYSAESADWKGGDPAAKLEDIVGRYSWTDERLDRLQDSYWTDATKTGDLIGRSPLQAAVICCCVYSRIPLTTEISEASLANSEYLIVHPGSTLSTSLPVRFTKLKVVVSAHRGMALSRSLVTGPLSPMYPRNAISVYHPFSIDSVSPLLASAQRIGSWYKSSSRTKKGSELKARKKSISDKVLPKDEKKRPPSHWGRARSEGLPNSLG
ncbi:unnamed protein product [Dovyalis caffra]|uniref:Uncharacterized protein n=1 Tax=Dovyalis caffra TaxID=77055 RepID=A0AAV1R8D0_9ROSI|nr:unnamed protein product [Dovyalis caffra]